MVKSNRHPTAVCLSEQIGEDTNIGPMTYIASSAIVGQNCDLEHSVFIGENVQIGNNVSILAGSYISKDSQVADDVVIGPQTVLSPAVQDVVNASNSKIPGCAIERGVTIGSACLIGRGLRIGENAHVKDGTFVDRNIPANVIVSGNPARIVGYHSVSNTASNLTAQTNISADESGIPPPARMLHFKSVNDLRGDLTAIEFDPELPFIPKRIFMVYGVESESIRGEHAHYSCEQILIAMSGTIDVIADTGKTRGSIQLSHPRNGLYLPPMTWGVQYGFSRDAVLLVLASKQYDPTDYIRDYVEFLQIVNGDSLSIGIKVPKN